MTAATEQPRVQVLHLSPDPRMGGGMAAVVRGLLASPLAERYGLQVVATYRHRDPIRRLTRFGVGLLRLTFWSLGRRGRLVHIHTTARGSLYRKSIYVLVAKALRRRVVLHVHAGAGDLAAFGGRIGEPSRALFRQAFARADAVLSVSRASAQEVTRAFGRGNVMVIPNAAPRVDRLPSRSADAADAPALLYLGGFQNPAKGGDLLLDALAIIAEECPRLRVTLAGPGELPYAGSALIARHAQITWRGWLDEAAKAAALGAADIVVVPSYSEGLPVTLLEAMAHGRAIVATTVGGIPEVLTDGVDATLVAPGRAVVLAGAVCALARDPARRAQLGAAARARARHLNEDEVAARLDALYRRLLAAG
jgi:glycosyltransferase involved in cell wall biosynthesis